MAKLPAAAKKLLATHPAKKTLIYSGSIPMFAPDQEMVLDVTAAEARLDGEETGYDDKKHAPIGMTSDLPLLVDIKLKTLPVKVLLEGRLVAIAPLAEFVKKLAAPKPPAPGPKKGEKLLEPATVKGTPDKLPAGKYFVATQTEGPFLWAEVSKANNELYFAEMREGRSAAKRWKSATTKYDRGTGEFLDVAWYQYLVPVITPRVRALVEKLPLAGVEFLPLRVDVKGKKGDYFLMHTTRAIDCLDRAKCEFPDAERARNWGPNPKQIVLDEGKIPADAHLFRDAQFPAVTLWSRSLAEIIHGASLSGIKFDPPSAWKGR